MLISGVSLSLATMSWQDKVVKLTLLGFAGTVLYAGCTAPAVQREMRQYPILSEVAGIIYEVDEAIDTFGNLLSGNRNIDLVETLTDLHEPTKPIGDFGRDTGEKYFGLDYDVDLEGALEQLGDLTQPLIDLVEKLTD